MEVRRSQHQRDVYTDHKETHLCMDMCLIRQCNPNMGTDNAGDQRTKVFDVRTDIESVLQQTEI